MKGTLVAAHCADHVYHNCPLFSDKKALYESWFRFYKTAGSSDRNAKKGANAVMDRAVKCKDCDSWFIWRGVAGEEEPGGIGGWH